MKPALDLTLMLVTDPAMTRIRGLAATVRAAVAGGVTVVQLRDKDADDATLARIGADLMAMLAPLGVPLIVNDRPAVARAIGAAGAHIGQGDGDVHAARRLLGEDAVLGLSVTRAGEIATVDASVTDYVGLGPIFPTGSKTDAAPALGLAATAEIGARLSVPFVAIGGITAANAGDAIRAGAAGVAVVSAICAAHDPAAAARAIRDAVEAAR
jgi:thiamine-phosphate pyrophosphorylase